MRYLKFAPFLLLPLLLAACARSAPESAEPVKRFSIHGEVIRLEAQDRLATIKHQKIEGYMEAMTMAYPIKDQQEYNGLQPGNCIDGTVFVQGDNFWVGEIKHLDTPPGQCVAPPPPPAK